MHVIQMSAFDLFLEHHADIFAHINQDYCIAVVNVVVHVICAIVNGF